MPLNLEAEIERAITTIIDNTIIATTGTLNKLVVRLVFLKSILASSY